MFKKVVLLSLSVIIIFSMLIVWIVYYNFYIVKFDSEIIFEVKKGWGLHRVVRELYNKRIIKSFIFTYFPYLIFNRDYIAISGKYKFQAEENIIKVLEKIKKGETINISVTIIPGLNLREIGEMLEKEKIMSKEKFLNLSHSPEILKKYKIYKNTLEGFIFPETYTFSSGLSDREIVEIFVKYFFKKVGEIIDINKYSDKDFYNKIIVASLVEKEAMVDFERPIIASVIYNRLRKRMYLGLCPTVEYAIGEHKKRLDLEDLKVKSPYNTYIHKGLPPTPICSPSIQSIKAAFFPEKTDYLYYVAKFDGTHYFSETFEQHIYYKNLVKRERR